MKIEKSKKDSTYTISGLTLGKLMTLKSVFELKSTIAPLTAIQQDIYIQLERTINVAEQEMIS